ncbi:MAG: ABC transporter ATP-binding protein [Anaerolineae bacterium]
MKESRSAEQDSRPILATDHLRWSDNGETIVDGITVEIERGWVVAVVGPSGSGKTSFLRLLNRLSEPTSGRVFLAGQDTKDIDPPELRRRVGMMMPSPNLFPGTVADNVRFGPQQRGETMADEEVERLLERVDLPSYGDRSVSNLSVGEAQRVSLARTLANAPEVLLLDEPTSALDAESERKVEALICDIIESRELTCLIVTHDAAQARRMTGRALLIRDGQLKAFGDTEEVLDADTALR